MIMKLSEAIRLGAMAKPQGFGGSSIQGRAVCALGAAADAIGLPEGDLDARYRLLYQVWPQLMQCGPSGEIIRSTIWTLNDNLHYTREQIADWVEKIEDSALKERCHDTTTSCV